MQGAVDEVKMLERYADSLDEACEEDIKVAAAKGRPTLKHCIEAKPFEPAARDPPPTSDAMLAFISRRPEASGNGRSEPRVPSRTDVGPRFAAALARALMCRQTVALRHQRRVSPEARCRYRRRTDQSLDWLNVLVLLRTTTTAGPSISTLSRLARRRTGAFSPLAFPLRWTGLSRCGKWLARFSKIRSSEKLKPR